MTYVVERRELLDPLANRIKTAVGAAGIPITLNPLTATEVNDRELKADMPMFLRDLIRPFGPDAAYAALLFYISKANGDLQNAGNYVNAAVDKEFFAAQASTGKTRLEHLAKLQRLVFADLPQIPILLTPSQFAVRTGISCWQTGVHTARFWYFTVGNQPCIADGNKPS